MPNKKSTNNEKLINFLKFKSLFKIIIKNVQKSSNISYF